MISAKKLLNLVKLFLGWPLGIIAVVFLIKYLIANSNLVLSRINQVNLAVLGLSVLFFLVYYFMRAFAWGLMMEMMGHEVGFKNNVYAWQFSEIKRYVPGNVWSFLSRATLFEKLGVPKKVSGKGILMEIEFLVVSNMIISLLAINVIYLYLKQANLLIYGFISITLLLALFILLGHRISKKISRFLPDFGLGRNLLLLVVYLVTYLFLSLGMYFAVSSILKVYNFSNIIGFFSFAFLLGYVSLITPSGLGVREGAITFGLSVVLTAPIAGFAAIFSRIVLVFSELLFTSAIFIWHKSKVWNF